MGELHPELRLQIPRLRRKHKDLYLLDLGDLSGEYRITQVLLRPMTRREFMQAQRDVELDCDPTEIILEDTIVWPEIDWSNSITNPLYDLPFNVFDTIAEVAAEISGLSSDENIARVFNEARASVYSLDGVLTSLICSTFTSITPKMLDDMTFWDIARLFAMAETKLPEPIDLRLFLDPKYAESVARKEERQRKRQSRVPNRMYNDVYTAGDRKLEAMQAPPIPEGYQSSALPPNEPARAPEWQGR